MIYVTRTVTVDNTDMLSGTDLETIPEGGQLDVFIGSTQNDSEVSMTGPANEPIVQDRPIQLRTNGQPSLQDDVPFQMVVTQGGKYRINVNVVTAATVVMVAIFRALREI